jgi:hypothetical protein
MMHVVAIRSTAMVVQDNLIVNLPLIPVPHAIIIYVDIAIKNSMSHKPPALILLLINVMMTIL